MAITEYQPHPSTEKQIAYIASLRREAISSVLRTVTVAPDARSVACAAIAYSLPAEAATAAQASELIDAYKNPVGYARDHQDWARPILAKLALSTGPRGERTPVVALCYNCPICGPGRAAATIAGHHSAEAWFAEILS